jgi:hypothetical protein
MKYQFLILLIFYSVVSDAQQITQERDEDLVFEKMELRAQFPGGETGWTRFVEKNFELNALQAAVPDSVHTFSDSLIVRFIITKKGLIENPEFAAGGSDTFRNAIAAVLKKSPVWQPEIQGSGPVKSYVTYKFTFWWVADYGGVTVQRTKFPKQPFQ